jgi:hypothetical protein
MRKISYSTVLLVLLVGVIGILFYPLFLKGWLPIPADTIIGLYHPFRDLYAANFPHGIPFKNSLITDPVRQLYPWKLLAMDIFKSGNLPLWNPYEMAGKPLLANFQTGVFYPFNIIFLGLPFSVGWSFFILLQPLLSAIFMWMYLRNLRLSIQAAFLGIVAWILSGFFIAWLEWGNVIHTALWLPITMD